jgi:hypothetical protein
MIKYEYKVGIYCQEENNVISVPYPLLCSYWHINLKIAFRVTKRNPSIRKKKGNVYFFRNQSGVKFDSLLPRKIAFSFPLKLQLDLAKSNILNGALFN